MNGLNNQQIVLLCLLVAFVTSITTGVSVVSLNSQESQPITQTINRVVERTVETIIPSSDTFVLSDSSQEEKNTENQNLGIKKVSSDLLPALIYIESLDDYLLAIDIDRGVQIISDGNKLINRIISFPDSKKVNKYVGIQEGISGDIGNIGDVVLAFWKVGDNQFIKQGYVSNKNTTTKDIGVDFLGQNPPVGSFVADKDGNVMGFISSSDNTVSGFDL